MDKEQTVLGWLFADQAECLGELRVFVADESSYRCERCGWIGWPRKEVNPLTGVITRFYPHPRRDAPDRS